MKRSSRPLILLGSIASVSVAACSLTHAGTIRHDVADSLYTALAAQPEYAAVGKITVSAGTGSGTLIADRWVLTAAHVISHPYPNSVIFNIGGTDYAAVEWIPHAGFTNNRSNDIGLVRLSAAVVGVTAAARYTGSAELGATATIVGYGRTGTGLTGDTLASGIKRAGQNVLDTLGSSAGISGIPLTDEFILADFDRPGTPSESSYGSSTPLALEYSSASGDSGGGVFINVAGQTRLAGVVAFGVAGPISSPDSSANADYGDLMGFTRVSPFNGWIDDQISAIYWSNIGGGSFGSTANWADGVAPGAGNIAVFKAFGTYTTTLAANTANKRLRVRSGTITLDLASHTYSLSNTAAERSILVGQISGDTASLTFANGTVSAVDASLGEASGATGSLRLTGAGTSLMLSGSIGVGGSPTAAGGTGILTVEIGASLGVGGNLKIWNGGSASVSGSVNTEGFQLLANSLTGTGTVTASGLSTWSGGTISGGVGLVISPGGSLSISGNGTKTLTGASFLNNAGTVSWTGSGDISGSDSPATINNLAGGVFAVQNNESLSYSTGTGRTFNNAGTLRKSVGTGTTVIDWPFHNTGTVEVQTGTLQLLSGGTSTGIFNTASGATLEFYYGTHNLNNGATITGAGTLSFAGATVNMGAAALGTTGPIILSAGTLSLTGNNTFNAFTWNGGTFTGNGTTTIAPGGTLTIAGVTKTLGSGRTLTNAGMVTLGGYLPFWSDGVPGAVINNQLGAIFDIQDRSSVSVAGGGQAVFNNAGLLKKSAGASNTVSWTFHNTGSVEVQTSTLNLSGGGTSSGSFTISSGAVLNLSGGIHNLNAGAAVAVSSGGTLAFGGGTHNLAVGATISGAGTLSFAGATVNMGAAALGTSGPVILSAGTLSLIGNNTFNTLTWNSGTFTGNGTTTIGPGGTMTMSGSYTIGYLGSGRMLNNAGLVILSVFSGGLYSYEAPGAVFNNQAGASFDFQGSSNVGMDGGGQAIFNNAGLLKKSAGNLTSTVSWTFNNTGSVEVQTSTLRLAGGGTSTGVFNTASGATLEFYGGTHNLHGGSSLTGSGLVTVAGGTVNFSGNVNITGVSALTVSGGTFNWNNEATMISLPGGLNLSGGTLSVNTPLTLGIPVTFSSGAQSGTSTLTISSLTWSGGTMSGSGSTNVATGGTLTMSGSSTKTVTDRSLVINGLMVQTGSGGLSSTGPLTVSGTAAVFDLGASHNATAATVTVDGGGSITGTGTSGVTAILTFEMKSGAVVAILKGTGIPLNKTTTGTVTLSGANTYTGATTVSGGVLRLDSASALPGGIANTGGTSRLTFTGGILGLGNGDFTRGLGTGAAQAGFTGSGGFAAYTANRTVNLGGAGAGVAWDTGSFVPTGSALILGAATADATVTFQNPINLGAAVRTVQVEDGSAATDAKLTGALTSSGGGLLKTGSGTLNLDNATQSYDTLTASAGTTNVNGTLGTLPGLAVVTVSPNAQLKFGTVSQTLASLSIGAGATVTFTSGPASFADSGDGKAPGLTGDLTGNAAVPEPGTLALLLTGALGVLGRRRRRETGK